MRNSASKMVVSWRVGGGDQCSLVVVRGRRWFGSCVPHPLGDIAARAGLRLAWVPAKRGHDNKLSSKTVGVVGAFYGMGRGYSRTPQLMFSLVATLNQLCS